MRLKAFGIVYISTVALFPVFSSQEVHSLDCAEVLSNFPNDDSQTELLAGAIIDGEAGQGIIFSPSHFRLTSGHQGPLEWKRRSDEWTLIIHPEFYRQRRGRELDAFKNMVVRFRGPAGQVSERAIYIPEYPEVRWDHWLSLNPGDIIEFPDANRSIRLPTLDVPSTRTAHLNYHLQQTLSNGLAEAYSSSHRKAAPRSDSYFDFARNLGWRPGEKVESIELEKLRRLYQGLEQDIADGRRHANSLIYPAVLLEKKDDNTVYFLKPWESIPSGYEILKFPYLDDRQERALNALGYFSFGVENTFAVHDLLGHLRVLAERPQFASMIRSVSEKMLSGVEFAGRDSHGIQFLKRDNIFAYVGLRERAKFSIVSEQSIAGDKKAFTLFQKLTWISRLGPGGKIQGRLAKMYQAEEKRDPGFLDRRAKIIFDFYKAHIILTGGVSNDPSLLSGAFTLPHYDGRFFGIPNTTYFLYLASLVKNLTTITEIDAKAAFLAAFETVLDFWIKYSPEEILSRFFDDDDAMTLAESAIHHQIFSSVSKSTDLFSSYAWLPKGNSERAIKIRREYWKDAFTDAFYTYAMSEDRIGYNVLAVSYMVEDILTTWNDETDPEILDSYSRALKDAYRTLDRKKLEVSLRERRLKPESVFKAIHIEILEELISMLKPE